MTLAELFDRRMKELFSQSGKSIGYWPSRFLQAVRSHGGVAYAKSLLNEDTSTSSGFERLLEAGRMDLSVEYLATREPFRRLFSDAELSVARSRLDALPGGAFSNAEWSTDREDYSEGRMRQVTLSIHERNPAARAACLRHYGTACLVCGFDFEATYGDIGRGTIQVHHLKPISETDSLHRVDPVKDLVPVCANCHVAIHGRTPPYSVAELRKALSSV